MNSQLQLADAPEEDKINSTMTIAVNAAQLMVFGPSTAPVGQSILTRPINPRWLLRHPKGANDVAFGDYSYDDLYGAIVSFLYVVHNRKGNSNKLTDRPGQDTKLGDLQHAPATVLKEAHENLLTKFQRILPGTVVE
ncbi:unnamed protein product [Clonostachys byssicola]|uniref:Uncharacterized protein n=1 Tax=Clonostachys byssicola TaxID=160290 RepID=A0A9N9UGS8_9HYPO|nr:unnamed protein product [Clonostachys byssicola]